MYKYIVYRNVPMCINIIIVIIIKDILSKSYNNNQVLLYLCVVINNYRMFIKNTIYNNKTNLILDSRK